MEPELEKLPEVERLPEPEMEEALEPEATAKLLLLIKEPEETVRVF